MSGAASPELKLPHNQAGISACTGQNSSISSKQLLTKKSGLTFHSTSFLLLLNYKVAQPGHRFLQHFCMEAAWAAEDLGVLRQLVWQIMWYLHCTANVYTHQTLFVGKLHPNKDGEPTNMEPLRAFQAKQRNWQSQKGVCLVLSLGSTWELRCWEM